MMKTRPLKKTNSPVWHWHLKHPMHYDLGVPWAIPEKKQTVEEGVWNFLEYQKKKNVKFPDVNVN